MSLLRSYTKHLRMHSNDPSQTLLKVKKEEGTFANSFYEPNTILIPKPETDTLEKKTNWIRQHVNWILYMSKWNLFIAGMRE